MASGNTGREKASMGLTMREKQTVTLQLVVEDKRATRKQKGVILDALTELFGELHLRYLLVQPLHQIT